MEKWPIGVFTSVDAGLGVKLEVAHELGVPTIQLHAPAKSVSDGRQCRPVPGQAGRIADSTDRCIWRF